MTATALATPDPERPEVTHPDWCQRDRCKVNADGSITHAHLLGTVDGAEVSADVVAERTDTPDDKGKVKPGPARTFTYINRIGRVTPKELDRMSRLQGRAALFTGQRQSGVY